MASSRRRGSRLIASIMVPGGCGTIRRAPQAAQTDTRVLVAARSAAGSKGARSGLLRLPSLPQTIAQPRHPCQANEQQPTAASPWRPAAAASAAMHRDKIFKLVSAAEALPCGTHVCSAVCCSPAPPGARMRCIDASAAPTARHRPAAFGSSGHWRQRRRPPPAAACPLALAHPPLLAALQAKGFRGRAKNCIRVARERVEKSLQYAFRDRKAKASGGWGGGVRPCRHALLRFVGC